MPYIGIGLCLHYDLMPVSINDVEKNYHFMLFV